eukprot:CAMPEP_0185614734 /NCGR_PEP_ID=MMETSP0436-20130131/33015_1 /TAXON_ID=626734 ORGANISM="Favella taraikaensis, Strain Fe Narragansett Bay" /NCGR_SAMPLE_ID=MMETSP0436 /ASSEMBLY_ACC=CAM_ASM_000390 /LENGTH=36 /DNA_ID= /DNA_START= /DNA_END= /DNA_ORIENTATION=
MLERRDKLKFMADVPDQFKGPISDELMEDPVIIESG